MGGLLGGGLLGGGLLGGGGLRGSSHSGQREGDEYYGLLSELFSCYVPLTLLSDTFTSDGDAEAYKHVSPSHADVKERLQKARELFDKINESKLL